MTSQPLTQAYPWIDQDLNAIQFYHRDAIERFFLSWEHADSARVSILHLGDSHIQPDIFPGVLRKRFQELLGKGGRGLMFPFSTAKTYSSVAYSSTHQGAWTASRSIEPLPKYTLGVCGATCRTNDSMAGFNIKFSEPIPDYYSTLRIFCKKSPYSYSIWIRTDEGEELYRTDIEGDTSPYIEINNLPPLQNGLGIRVEKTSPLQEEFEFYGMSLESSLPGGAIIHSAGIGGARFNAPLYQKLFLSQLPLLNPGLVILDYGTNDYIYDDKIKPELEHEITQIIGNIRSVSPNTCILLTTTQDMMRKGQKLRAGEQFSDLIRKIAREQNCALYDWFWISGGNNSIGKWVSSGLAQQDMIHLTKKGYTLKGELLFDAFLRTQSVLLDDEGYDSLVFSLDSIRKALPPAVDSTADSLKPVATVRAPQKVVSYAPQVKKKQVIRHKVKSGETLSFLARKYHVTVKQIQQWNRISGSRIRIGQTLIIYKTR
ncbi:MAG: LysM peptidoglycan-binding domain-containing protein [Bacteroidetes bacterium]|nr:LysM peptidoglycan-binding domain-containing protein [Bacteroidota bacterium]